MWVQCVGCGVEKWISLDNVTSQKTRGCQSCSQTVHPLYRWLRRRLCAAKARCQNSRDPHYADYGGRGVKFEWPDVRSAVLYALTNLALPEKACPTLEIDRKDNSGNYAPGNLRFCSRQDNLINRRNTVVTCLAGRSVPRVHAVHVFRHLHPEVRYSDVTLRRLLGEETEAQILARWDSPSCKPKGVYGTFSTPDPDIVSRYLGGS